MFLQTYRLVVILVNIDWVIMTACSNSFIMALLRAPDVDSSLVLSLWWSCITEFVVKRNCDMMFDIS